MVLSLKYAKSRLYNVRAKSSAVKSRINHAVLEMKTSSFHPFRFTPTQTAQINKAIFCFRQFHLVNFNPVIFRQNQEVRLWLISTGVLASGRCHSYTLWFPKPSFFNISQIFCNVIVAFSVPGFRHFCCQDSKGSCMD